jgi:hypothetical protein
MVNVAQGQQPELPTHFGSGANARFDGLSTQYEVNIVFFR